MVMTADFVATISRVARGSIESESYDNMDDALKDILKNWDGDATSVGELVVDEMSVEQADQVTAYLLSDADGEQIFNWIEAAGYVMTHKPMVELTKLLLEGLDDADRRKLAEATLADLGD